MAPSADWLTEPDADGIDLGPEAGWIVSNPLEALHSQRNFVHDDPHGDRIRIRYYREAGRDALIAKVWFGPGAEGPPGHAHGGSLLAVIDEVAGGTVWVNGLAVVLARMETDMRKPVPLGRVMIVEGEIDRIDGRKVYSNAVVRDAEGTVYVEARGLFVKLDDKQFEYFKEHAQAARDGTDEGERP